MRGAYAKLLAALVVALLALVLALVLALPRMLESETVRGRIRDQTSALLGAPLDWSRTVGRVRPLSVSLEEPVLARDPRAGESEPALRLDWRAPAVDARLALAALLEGRIEVEAVASRDGTLVVRDRWGSQRIDARIEAFSWRARPADGASRVAAPLDLGLSGRLGPTSEVEVAGRLVREAPDAFALDADRLRLRVDDLELSGHGTVRVRRTDEGGLAFDVELDLGEGGGLAFRGRRDDVGAYRVDARLDDFDLAPAAVLLDWGDLELAGRATGGVTLSAEAATDERATLDLVVADAHFRVPDIVARGALPIEATIGRPFSDGPRGRLALDLTDATVEYRGGLRKPAGIGANLETKFTPDPSGRLVFESRVSLRDLDQILSPEVLRRFGR